MSNFSCEHCGAVVSDTAAGYVTGCEHYPIEKRGLAKVGHRYVDRAGEFRWVHEAELQPGDVDCTDMDDEAFEAHVVRLNDGVTRVTLDDLITGAVQLAGETAVSHGARLWDSVGGRACPIGWGDCSQPVYVDIKTGEYDYGEPGGPGDAASLLTAGFGGIWETNSETRTTG